MAEEALESELGAWGEEVESWTSAGKFAGGEDGGGEGGVKLGGGPGGVIGGADLVPFSPSGPFAPSLTSDGSAGFLLSVFFL